MRTQLHAWVNQWHFTQTWRRKKHCFQTKTHKCHQHKLFIFKSTSFSRHQPPYFPCGLLSHMPVLPLTPLTLAKTAEDSHISFWRYWHWYHSVPLRGLLALPSERRWPPKGCNKFAASACAYVTRWGMWIGVQKKAETQWLCQVTEEPCKCVACLAKQWVSLTFI